jgi:hypothetical protein
LLAAALGFSVLLCPIAFWFFRWPGVVSVLAAALLCTLTGMVAFWTSRLFVRQVGAVGGALVAMGVRMAIPLVVCLVLAVRGDADSLAGFVYYLLVFYLATLAVETWCSLPPTRTLSPASARE